MSNTVEIAIVARDLVSPIINAISGKFGALDVVMGGIRAGFGLLSGDIQAAAQGIQTMIGGVQKLAGEFGEAAKLQTKFLADAGSFSAISGLGLQQAKGFMSEFNIELAKMAASLPGATKDYTDLANSIGSTLVRGFNVKSTDGLKNYRDQLEGIVKTVTILGQSQGIGANDNALFVNRFLGGASVSELRLYQFAERNSAFLERVKAELKTMGKAETDFKGLSVDTKARILNKVSSSLVTPELIAELQGTADAMLETIKTNISDPYIGAFGFLRKVPSAGNRTVMDGFTKFLGSWMDLGSTISIMASHLGITIDPLKPLIDVLDFLANFGDRANDFLSAINLTKGFQGVDLTGMFVGLFEGLAGWFNSGIAGLTGFIWNLDISQLGIWVSGLFNSYLVGMTAWLNSIDWANLGRSLGLGFVKLVSFFVQAIYRINWSSVLVYLGSGILAVCRFFIGLVVGLVEGLVKEIPSIIQAQIEGAAQAWKTLIDQLKGLADLIGGWIDKARSFFRDPVGQVVQTITPQPVKEALEVVPKPVREAAKNAGNAAVQLIPGVGVITRIGELIDIIQGKPKAPATTPPINPQANPNTPTTTSPIQPQASQGTTQVSQLPSPLPTSQPLVTPNVSNTSQQVATNVFNPQVTIPTQTGLDPQVIAQIVSDRIMSDYQRFLQEQLA